MGNFWLPRNPLRMPSNVRVNGVKLKPFSMGVKFRQGV